MKRSLIVLLLFLFHSSLFGQQLRVLQTFVGEDSGDRFGSSVLGTDVNKDGFQDLIISAPDWGPLSDINGSPTLRGRIYLLRTPISEPPGTSSLPDSSIDESSVIIQSSTNFTQIGQKMATGDFNGDGNPDLALSLRASDNSQIDRVAIFYGPLDFNPSKDISQADHTIFAEQADDGFGSNLVRVNDYNSDGRDELIIAANRYDGNSTNTGKLYLFQNLITLTTEVAASQASSSITGTEIFAGFGASVIAPGDIDGDGNQEILVGAPTSSGNGFRNGRVYGFQLPLPQPNNLDSNYELLFEGFEEQGRWGSILHSFGDINTDGFADFGITTLGIGGGRLVYYPGRTTWRDTLFIGQFSAPEDSGRVFTAPSGLNGFGFSAVFSADFDINGIKDPIIAAPSTSVDRGNIRFFNLETAGALGNIASGGRNNARFGETLVNLGNVSEEDLYEIDDVAVSAPGDGTDIQGEVTLYRGVITPPSLSVSADPSTLVELGTTITLTANITKGSRDISLIRLIRDAGTGAADTSNLGDDISAPIEVQIQDSVDANRLFIFEVIDDLGITVSTNRTLSFAARPEEFDLITEIDELLEVEGDRGQTLRLETSASADTNGRAIRYRLYFGTSESQFEDGSSSPAVSITGWQNSNIFDLTFNDVANFLLENLIPINQEIRIFWDVEASNQVLNRESSNGPKSFSVIRQTLDPYLFIVSGDIKAEIFGLATETIDFDWENLVSDEQDPIVQYDFMILGDDQDRENPIFVNRTGNEGLSSDFSLSFGRIDSILTANELKEAAEQDTITLYYDVDALINGLSTWQANNGPKQFRVHFERILSRENDDQNELPSEIVLKPNYPNPFNPSTTIQFGLPESGQVDIYVFNLLGQQVARLAQNRVFSAGWHKVSFDASALPSGIYFYQVRLGEQIFTRKMTLLK